MKFKAVIFDLDGVICSTDHYHYLAWKTIADRLNIYFDEEINNRLRGVSRMESLEIILERYQGVLTKEQKEAYADEKNQVYRKLLGKMSSLDLSNEVFVTLEKIKQRGIKIAIGSSSKNAKFILERIGLVNHFDAISDGNQIKNSKPDPEVFLRAAMLLNINPSDCLVVEDALAGVEAASNAGMKCAAIGDAASSLVADYNMKSFSDLLTILEL